MTAAPLKILVVGPSRHPLRQPHRGGLEACVWERVRGLRARGHQVVLAAPRGSDFLGADPDFTLPSPVWCDPVDASDSTYPAGYSDVVDTAFDRMLARVASGADGFDLVDNHSLHSAPIAWSGRLGIPMVTTLHTPPLPEMIAGHWAAAEPPAYLAVSAHTAREWGEFGVDAGVLANGVDTRRWTAGPGGNAFVWFGRIVPEKAPHLAIDAARRATRPIVIAGHVGDLAYFEEEVVPRLARDARYAGPLRQRALNRLVGRSACALVTPVWDEPFGLVIAEAMATGTPVAAFDAGGVSEVIGGARSGAVVAPGDVDALARAARSLARRASNPAFRAEARSQVERRLSLGQRHAEVEEVFRRLVEGARAPVAA